MIPTMILLMHVSKVFAPISILFMFLIANQAISFLAFPLLVDKSLFVFLEIEMSLRLSVLPMQMVFCH